MTTTTCPGAHNAWLDGISAHNRGFQRHDTPDAYAADDTLRRAWERGWDTAKEANDHYRESSRPSQAAINADTFAALPVGAFFQVLTRRHRYLRDRYVKVDAEHVQSIGDGRRWHFGHTEGSGGHTTLYVEAWSIQAAE